MTYAVNFETTPRAIAVKLSTGSMMHASFGSVQYVNTGKQGIDGTTFYPSVEGDECTLSWTNDGNKENPKPVNLRGGSTIFSAKLAQKFHPGFWHGFFCCKWPCTYTG